MKVILKGEASKLNEFLKWQRNWLKQNGITAEQVAEPIEETKKEAKTTRKTKELKAEKTTK